MMATGTGESKVSARLMRDPVTTTSWIGPAASAFCATPTAGPKHAVDVTTANNPKRFVVSIYPFLPCRNVTGRWPEPVIPVACQQLMRLAVARMLWKEFEMQWVARDVTGVTAVYKTRLHG